jgi:hypothetical protein
MFFCFQSSSASLCLFHLLRAHSTSILFFPEEDSVMSDVCTHTSLPTTCFTQQTQGIRSSK